MTAIERRTTKYVTAIKQAISTLGHATNAELLGELRVEYPGLSPTTIHRVTQRLYEDGELGRGPKAPDGAVRYDANLEQHDHFMCNMCGGLRDTIIPQSCRSIIQCGLEDCRITGALTVSGICMQCHNSLKEVA